jgi:hypothetical protein
MDFPPPPLSGIISEPITLLPPRLKTWLGTYRILYAVLLGPLLFIGLGLHYWSGMNLVQFASAMTAALILFMNVYFYVLRKRKEEIGISIWIDLDEIQLLKKGVILNKDSLKNLHVIKMGRPANPKNLPNTLLIEGKHFPRLYIRSAQSIKIWRSMEKTDFCVTSEKEWKRLVNALASYQEG